MRQRPIAVTVFGILNIGYALWTLVMLIFEAAKTRMNLRGNAALDALNSDPTYVRWTHFSTVIGAVFGVILIVSGIGMLLLQNWARVLAIVYSVLQIISVLLGALFIGPALIPAVIHAITSQVHNAPANIVAPLVKVIFAVGTGLSLCYPVLLLVFMTRRKVVDAFNSQEPPH